jgi:hypothetical protein
MLGGLRGLMNRWYIGCCLHLGCGCSFLGGRGLLGCGLDFRLGWGIGVQRGYFDYFCGLGVGRGFGRRLLKLRRRL